MLTSSLFPSAAPAHFQPKYAEHAILAFCPAAPTRQDAFLASSVAAHPHQPPHTRPSSGASCPLLKQTASHRIPSIPVVYQQCALSSTNTAALLKSPSFSLESQLFLLLHTASLLHFFPSCPLFCPYALLCAISAPHTPTGQWPDSDRSSFSAFPLPFSAHQPLHRLTLFCPPHRLIAASLTINL